MLRIDPTLSLVWRTPDTIQIGFPDAVVRLTLSPAQEHLLVALRAGVNNSTLYALGATHGLDRGACEVFVESLRPALSPGERIRRRIGIDGHGQTAEAIARVLNSAFEVRFVNSANVAHERVSADRRIHSAKRAKIARQEAVEGTRWRPDVVVVVGAFAIDPVRAGVWLRRDIAHLAVIAGDRVSRVGPMVTPGDGACLNCVEMNLVDADESRIAMLSQLHGKPCGGESVITSSEIATKVFRVLAVGLTPGEVLECDSATGEWTSAWQTTCSRCSCRALRENETAAVA